MTVLRRYFSGEIYRSVAFVLIAFLALFAFLDMMGEIKSVGQGAYRIEHAFAYVSLGLPNYAYQIMPIAALIGTIYVMAQFAARSEFTVMRASSLSMSGVMRLLLPIAVVFAVLTLLLGEFIAPRSNDFRESFKRRIQGATISSEFRSGLWAKDVLRDPVSKQVVGTRFLNAGKVEADGVMRLVRIYEFDLQMHMLALITADEGHFANNNQWRLMNVKEMRFARDPERAGHAARTGAQIAISDGHISSIRENGVKGGGFARRNPRGNHILRTVEQHALQMRPLGAHPALVLGGATNGH